MRRPSGENAAVTTPSLAGEHGDLRGRGRVPDARRLVAGGGDDAPPIGRERGGHDGTAMAGEDGQPGVGRAHFLKHVDRRSRPRRRGVPVREDFDDDALRARNVSVPQIPGCCVGEQAQLGRQRQLRLGLGFMLLLQGDQAGSGGKQRKNGHDAGDEGQHANRATAYALVGGLRALDVVNEIGLGVRAMLAQETLSVDQVELGEKSGFATSARAPGRESRAQCCVALALAGSVSAGFLEPAPQRVAFLDAAADLEGFGIVLHEIARPGPSRDERLVGHTDGRRAARFGIADQQARIGMEQRLDQPALRRARRKRRQWHPPGDCAVDVAVGGAHLDQREQHRTERLSIVGRAALQYRVRPSGNRALQPAEPLVGRKGQGGALGFEHIAAIELIQEIGEQRQCPGFVGDLLCDDLVERHVGRRVVFEADTRRGCGTPDDLAQLRLSGRQELEPAMAFRHVVRARVCRRPGARNPFASWR